MSWAAWLGLAGVGLGLYGWWEASFVEVTARRLLFPELPLGLDGLRILHISDTHFPADGDSVGRFLERVWALEADLICCTGDYVETAAGWAAAADALTQLRAPLGVFAVLGAHDYCPPIRSASEWWSVQVDRALGSPRRFIDPQPFVSRLEAAGVQVLRNEWRTLEIGGEPVRLAGAGDASARMTRLQAALPPPDGRFSILLTHSPDAVLGIEDNTAQAPSLVLCGHTHGGQIRLPGWGAPVRHSQLVRREQAAGVFQRGASTVVVSRGFGTAHVPLRVGCRPELGLLTLARA